MKKPTPKPSPTPTWKSGETRTYSYIGEMPKKYSPDYKSQAQIEREKKRDAAKKKATMSREAKRDAIVAARKKAGDRDAFGSRGGWEDMTGMTTEQKRAILKQTGN